MTLSACQRQPVRITNQIASITRCAGTKDRPPRRQCGGSGNKDSIPAQSPSTNFLVNRIHPAHHLLPADAQMAEMVGSEIVVQERVIVIKLLLAQAHERIRTLRTFERTNTPKEYDAILVANNSSIEQRMKLDKFSVAARIAERGLQERPSA